MTKSIKPHLILQDKFILNDHQNIKKIVWGQTYIIKLEQKNKIFI